MPLYEYECDACGHRFEIIQKFSDPPLERCPKCGGTVHKLQSAPAFQFKGSGWYITDYARKESGSRSGEAKSDAKSDASGGESKPAPANETKTDAKTDSKSDAAPSTPDSKPAKPSS